MEGRVTCNEEKCQQSPETGQKNTEEPSTISTPVVVAPVGSRINTDTFVETGEKGLAGNVGPPGW